MGFTEPGEERREWGAQKKSGRQWQRQARQAYPVELRVRAVQEVTERKASAALVARAMGVPYTTLLMWVEKYRKHGIDGLMPKPRAPVTRKSASGDAAKRRAVTELKQRQPDLGSRR